MERDFREFFNGLRDIRTYRVVIALGVLAVGAFFFMDYLLTTLLVASVGLVAWTMNRMGELKRFGIELTTFATVLIAVVHGPYIGAVTGLGLILLQIVAGQYTGGYIIWVIPSYMFVGCISGVFATTDIFVLGALLTVGMQVFFASMTAVTSLGRLEMYMPYAVTNVGFNLLLFYYLAPILLELMV